MMCAQCLFFHPVSAELKNRLERRAEDAATIISKRLHNSLTEIKHWREYDYVLVNDDLDKTFRNLLAILTAERLKRTRTPALDFFVDTLFHQSRDVLSTMKEVHSSDD
jgi:guanylate kinase